MSSHACEPGDAIGLAVYVTFELMAAAGQLFTRKMVLLK